MDRELIEKLIQILKDARKTPSWYIGGKDPRYVRIFLSGLHHGLGLFVDLGPEQQDIRNELARSMGLNSASHTKDLKELGYSDKEAIEKLFTLEINAWEKVLSSYEDDEQP